MVFLSPALMALLCLLAVNAMAMRDFTKQKTIPFAEFAHSTAFQVRFIEFMPLDADQA